MVRTHRPGAVSTPVPVPVYSNDTDGIVLRCLTYRSCCLHMTEDQDLRRSDSSSTQSTQLRRIPDTPSQTRYREGIEDPQTTGRKSKEQNILVVSLETETKVCRKRDTTTKGLKGKYTPVVSVT